ncbi:MAG: YraN family protein [Kiritimatiellae bacterium]|nr:YraN family protein [Kiritimatiellia bacterium]
MKGFIERIVRGKDETLNVTARAGLWGESCAEKHLSAVAGFKILGRRVKVSPRDEIDLVARDGDVLVFVEVKTRASEAFGRPMDAVDRAKRHTLSRAAVRYLKKLKNPRVAFRFDVVEVIGREEDGSPEICHTPNAFHLDRCYRLP